MPALKLPVWQVTYPCFGLYAFVRRCVCVCVCVYCQWVRVRDDFHDNDKYTRSHTNIHGYITDLLSLSDLQYDILRQEVPVFVVLFLVYNWLTSFCIQDVLLFILIGLCCRVLTACICLSLVKYTWNPCSEIIAQNCPQLIDSGHLFTACQSPAD